MSIILVTGSPEERQRKVVQTAMRREHDGFWWSTGPDPSEVENFVALHAPFTAVAALAARFADKQSKILTIPTLEGFGGLPEREARREDHTELTVQLSKRAWQQPHYPDSLAPFVIDNLSQLYDDATTTVARTAPTVFGDKALTVARLMAANALTHLVWDLSRRLPVICLCWDELGKTKPVVHAPRQLAQIADLIVEVVHDETVVRKAAPEFRWRAGHTGTTLNDLIWGKIVPLTAAG